MPLGAASAGTPPTCQIRNWTVFGPGFHKGALYSLADCQEMGRNFQLLSAPKVGQEPLLEPSGNVGHDLQARLEASLGFPSLGTITGCRVAPDGLITIDMDGIPTQFGGLINAGWYRDGSIEIAPPLPHPEDQKRELYPVLTGVGFLGEEQPAVPVRYPIPKCTFADGTEVPAEHDLTPLAQAMAEVSRNFAASARVSGGQIRYRGQVYSTTAVCFSAMSPLPREQRAKPMSEEQKAALAAKGFTPEQIADIEASMAPKMAAVPPPADPKPPAAMADDPMAGLQKFADDPAMPEPMKGFAKAFAATFSKFAADCNKRFSSAEAAVGEMQKDKPEMKAAAAFASEYKSRITADHKKRVETVVDEAILAGKVEARDRDIHISHGEKQLDTQVFAAGHASAGKTHFAAWRDELLARKPSRMFSAAIEEPSPGDPTSDPFVTAAMRTLPGGRELAYPTAAAK